MLVPSFQLAWQFYHQEKRYAYQFFNRWIQITLMVFIVTLSQTSQSIQSFLTQNLENLLGADLVISQRRPLSKAQSDWLQKASQAMVLTTVVSTTLTHEGKWQRAKLKAVGRAYPLQGALRAATSLDGSESAVKQGPLPGEIWLDARLIASMEIGLGETLSFANRALTVTKILMHEPDRLMEGHNVDMRALLNLDDMKELNFPDDIVQHRYLFKADSDQTLDILAWQKENLPGAQIYHKRGAHPLALFWTRIENFIGLASIILFFMAAIAIEQLTRVQMRKEHYFSAICMSLGASKTRGLGVSVLKCLLRLIMILPMVLVISGACHWLLLNGLSHTFNDLTWRVDIVLAFKSILLVCSVFLIFQLPVWWELRHVSVARLVNNTQGKMSYWLSFISSLSVLIGLAFLYSDNGLLTTMVLASMLVSIVLILLISWLALSLGEKATQNISGLVPFALYMMKQRLVSKCTQILGVGLCAFLLLFTLMFMRDLGSTLSDYQRQHDGNFLISQATHEQMIDISEFAAHHNIEIRQSKPYMYAKLTKINGVFLESYSQKPSDSMATMKKSIRLHWTDAVPENNRVNQGQWWSAGTQNWQQLSVEQEVMTDLNLNVGDILSFYVGEQSIDFKIAASHVYKPGAGSITFWVQMPPSALAYIDGARYSMASLELDEPQFSLLGGLWQKHPTLRMTSLKELTARFDTLRSMMTKIISGFSFLIIGLASIVILSSIHASESREKKKNGIIMSFGFSRRTCLQISIIEWSVTGVIAAIGAITGTYIAGMLIYESQFSLSYQPDFIWLFATLAIILLVVTSFGVYASKNSLASPIRDLLADQ